MKIVDRRKIDDLMEKLCRERSNGDSGEVLGEGVRHVERNYEDRLPRMAYVHQEKGRRKIGRPIFT